ncbi:FAD-dependent oxidoreductase [Streptomyces sp. WMMC940]|uniref:FAD-dependent oxidoreductase n=1 Tax=Streptomyces sp. WMMC940 TaxID=3015153 RepID=UPI0022B68B3C|nr:FAD-dependent oxidoreductase [Streptomyces sp. WMMC940]MCZ7461679.1 FAD-dependent oxidoreductase [Streptomyces sp. WMMC940]
MAHETSRQALPEPPGSEPLPRAAEVVVIGGGAIGASTAFRLAEAGVRDVLVLERDTPASGSSGKPIGVRAQFSDQLDIRLGQRGLRAWREFDDRPGADVGPARVGRRRQIALTGPIHPPPPRIRSPSTSHPPRTSTATTPAVSSSAFPTHVRNPASEGSSPRRGRCRPAPPPPVSHPRRRSRSRTAEAGRDSTR